MRKFLFRFILLLIFLGAIGFIGFAYVGDLTPERSEQSLPVTIEAQ